MPTIETHRAGIRGANSRAAIEAGLARSKPARIQNHTQIIAEEQSATTREQEVIIIL